MPTGLEVVATFADRATPGLEALQGKLRQTGAAAEASAKGFGAATHSLRTMAQEGLGPIAAQIPGVGSLFSRLLSQLGGFPLAIGATVGAGVALISWLRDVQKEAGKTLTAITDVSSGIRTTTQTMALEVTAIRARAAGNQRAEAKAQAEKETAEAADQWHRRVRAAQIAFDEINNSFFVAGTTRTLANAKIQSEIAAADVDYVKKAIIARESLAATVIGIEKQEAQDRVKTTQEAEIARQALLAGTAALFKSLGQESLGGRFAILEALEAARPQLEKIRALFESSQISASEFRDAVEAIRRKLEELGATSQQVTALMSQQLSQTAETAEHEAQRMARAWDKIFEAARRGATSFSQEGAGGFTGAIKEGTKAVKEQEDALTGHSLDESLDTVGQAATAAADRFVDFTTRSLEGFPGLEEVIDRFGNRIGTVIPGTGGGGDAWAAWRRGDPAYKNRWAPDSPYAMWDAWLRGGGIEQLTGGQVTSRDIATENFTEAGRTMVEHAAEGFASGVVERLPTFSEIARRGWGGGPLAGEGGGGGSIPLGGGGGGGGGGFGGFISSLGLLLSFTGARGALGFSGFGGGSLPVNELTGENFVTTMNRLAGIYRQATGVTETAAKAAKVAGPDLGGFFVGDATRHDASPGPGSPFVRAQAPGVSSGFWGVSGMVKPPPPMAAGGIVPGLRGQPVPIMAHAGEVVIPEAVVRRYAGRRPGGRSFREGGMVGGGGIVVNITLTGAILDHEERLEELAQRLERKIRTHAQRRGLVS